MTKLKTGAAIALTAFIAAGCASTPKIIPELETARAELRQAKGDPLAQEAAGVRLNEAEAALAVAEKSATQRKPLPLIQHQSYLATQHARIAQAQISELRARQEVEQGETERNKVLLEARTLEAAASDALAASATREAAMQTAAASAARTEANAARSDADAARMQMASQADESARLRAELEGLQAKQTDRGMVLTLGDVLFATGQTTIRPGAMLTVERLADFLRSRPTLAVMIEGHTDSVGADDYNRDLSQRRSDAVMAALASRGVVAANLRSRGLGEGFPSASNDSPGGRQQNRRVEVVFSDADGKFAPSAERVSGL
jgi:outer membrane protein OmpA-like peptidoglycan-associated protein